METVIECKTSEKPIYLSNKKGARVIQVEIPKEFDGLERGKFYKATIKLNSDCGEESEEINSHFIIERNRKSMFNTDIDGVGLFVIDEGRTVPDGGCSLSIVVEGEPSAHSSIFDDFKGHLR